MSNRVAYIQERIPASSWHHIRSFNNPADLASRGCLPSELMSNTLWFNGPSFLQSSDIIESDKNLSNFSHPAISEETKKTVLFSSPNQENVLEILCNKFSSFNSIQRILAYCLRFIQNLKNKVNNCALIHTPLNSQELHNSLLILIKYTQQNSFNDEINRKDFSKPLKKLKVFVDKDDLLRVGGRLKFSNLPYDAKYPFLMPRKSRLTILLIEYYHKKYLHAGPRTLHFLISQNFWILSPRRAINSVLSKCLICWKINPKGYEPPMSDLPASRILQTKCFLHSGVDFAGPYLITLSRYRGVKTCKAYICLFVCLATKAIHLELASDLSSETFLSALQRFISRRGRCEKLYSDQGTNFVGAYNEIKKIMQYAANQEKIDWHFNPPSSPHFGGLWEAGVKAVKTHLTRVIGHQILTYEEFYTLLTLTESVLNSRPLTAMSADPDDINALTPGHFLTLEPLTPLPTPDLTGISLNRLSRWQLLQRLHTDFWNRWHKEYLHSLQQRSKWLTDMSLPAVGTLVLIKGDNTHPSQWALGRILSLSFGADGVARVATLKTKNGTLVRPLVKLCPLPSS